MSCPNSINDISGYCSRPQRLNVTEQCAVPSSEHVAEIVGRQGCKIRELRSRTHTYIKTPARGDNPIFTITGRYNDVIKAKGEILAAANHFSRIRSIHQGYHQYGSGNENYQFSQLITSQMKNYSLGLAV